MPRQIKPSGGRRFSETCVVPKLDPGKRWAILKRSRDHTRVAEIGPDGLTLDRSEKVSTADLVDVQPVTPQSSSPDRPGMGVVGDRGAVTIPAAMRRRHRLQAGDPVLIEDHPDGILIRPAEVVPRQAGPGWTLEALAAQMTPENRHGAVDTGEPTGREIW